jgi:hypothetical protein
MNTLTQNPQLNVGQQLQSINGRVNLVMQGNGNLVLYRSTFGLPLFATNTNGKPATRAVMQSDGNFVDYGTNNVAFWASGTSGHPGGARHAPGRRRRQRRVQLDQAGQQHPSSSAHRRRPTG